MHRRQVLALTLAALGAAIPAASRAAVLPQFSGGIPPFVWSLTSFPGVGPIAEPARYTVQFAADGSVSIGADCNRAAGVWSGGDGAIDITVTLSTVAFCPEDSLSQPFLDTLNAVTGYTLDGASLTLHGPAGDMTFTV
jgi:heat shock protein HslJ